MFLRKVKICQEMPTFPHGNISWRYRATPSRALWFTLVPVQPSSLISETCFAHNELVTLLALHRELPIHRNPIVTITLNEIQSNLRTDFCTGRIVFFLKSIKNKSRKKKKKILCSLSDLSEFC